MNRTSRIFIFIICWIVSLNAGNSGSNAIQVDQGGRLVLGGSANDDTNGNLLFALARYNQDGSLDTEHFNPQGVQPGTVTLSIGSTDSQITGIGIDSSNRIVAVGVSSDLMTGITSIAVARFTSTGILDTSFNKAGELPGVVLISISNLVDTALAVKIDRKQRIVLTGSTNNGEQINLLVLRLTDTGSLDQTFSQFSDTPGIFILPSLGTVEIGFAIDTDKDNNIYVGGTTDFDLLNDFLVVALTPDGFLNSDFNLLGLNIINISNAEDDLLALKLDNKNRIVVGGSSFDGMVSDFALARFLPDGNLDPEFNPNGTIPGIVVQPISNDNDVILGLTFDSDNNIVATGVSGTISQFTFATARFTPNGSLDGTFNSSGPVPGAIVQDLPTLESSTDFVQQNNLNGFATAVVVIKDTIFITGSIQSGTDRDFITISYTDLGNLNPGFNGIGAEVTHFGSLVPLAGNGVPLFLQPNLSKVSPDIIEGIKTAEIPIIPQFSTESFISRNIQNSVSGISQPFAFIRIYVNNIEMGTAIADRLGNWSVSLPPLIDGEYSVLAVATDSISGLSLASHPITMAINVQQIVPPVIILPTDNATLTQDPIIKGTAMPVTGISIVANGKVVGRALARKKGIWQTKIPLDDGIYSIYAYSFDSNGVESEPSNMITIKIETGKSRPVITHPIKRETNLSQVLVKGKSRPSARIMLLVDGKRDGEVTANSHGIWSYKTRKLPDGAHTIQAADRNLLSDVIRIIVDTIPPAPPKINTVRNQTISGKGEPKGQVTIFLDGRKTGSTFVDKQGVWQFTPLFKMTAGKHRIKATVADAAGNISKFVERELTF